MNIFESIENLRKSSEELEKRMGINNVERLYAKNIEIDPETSPLEKQSELLREILSSAKMIESQSAELKRMADCAEKSANIAEKESLDAKKDAKAAKRLSRINTIIAIVAIMVALAAWLVPREAALSAISSFFRLR